MLTANPDVWKTHSFPECYELLASSSNIRQMFFLLCSSGIYLIADKAAIFLLCHASGWEAWCYTAMLQATGRIDNV